MPFGTFPWNVLCDLSLMKLGNNWTKKKKARLCNICFYRKKFISKEMKAINKQNEKLENVRLFF